MLTEKHQHPKHIGLTSETYTPDQTQDDVLVPSPSTEHPNSATPAAPIMVQSAPGISYQQQDATTGPSFAPAPAPRTKPRVPASKPRAQLPMRKLSKATGSTRNNTHTSGSMTPAQRAAYIAQYTYTDMRETSVHTHGRLLPKIPSPHETAVHFYAPNAPGVDYSLFRKTTHNFLDFDATFELYPTYPLLPVAMKPSKEDWDETRDADQEEGQKVRCLFCRSRFGGRNAKAMWERHAKEHWEKGARVSYEKETKTKAPRSLSAKTLAQSRGHLPAGPERSANVIPRPVSVRAAATATVASTHAATSEAGSSNSRAQALYIRSGSPIRLTTEPVVRPPRYIRPLEFAYRSRECNPNVKLSKKEQAAQDLYTPFSDSDSDVESFYTDEEDTPSSSQSTVSASVQEPVLCPPHCRFFSTPCTPPASNSEPFKVRTTPFSRPGDLSQSPDILVPHDYPSTPIWTSADDEKLRRGEYSDSPTELLEILEQSTTMHSATGKKTLRPDMCEDEDGDNEGPWLNPGANYFKRSREEEEDDEELRRIWSPCKRAKTDTASPFDIGFGEDDDLKLGDFARGAMEKFDLEIKPAGPLLESSFTDDEALYGSWASDAFTPSSFDFPSPGTTD